MTDRMTMSAVTPRHTHNSETQVMKETKNLWERARTYRRPTNRDSEFSIASHSGAKNRTEITKALLDAVGGRRQRRLCHSAAYIAATVESPAGREKSCLLAL